jgi:hypothetical protein
VAEQRVVFLRPDAERIARAVRTVEAGNRNETPLTFRRVPEQRKSEPSIRMATFSGAWGVGATKAVNFRNRSETVNVVNLLWPLPDGAGGDCAISRDGTAWYLIVPRIYLANAATAAEVTPTSIRFNTIGVAGLSEFANSNFQLPVNTCSTAP